MMEMLKRKVYNENGVVRPELRALTAVFTFILLLAGTVYLYYHNPKEGLFIVCPIYTFTGFYCPGCGAGRACYSILHGRFHQAFRYNPMLILMLPWLGLYYLIIGIQWLKYGRERISIKIPEWIPLTLLILFFIYGIVRNIPTFPFKLLAPTEIGRLVNVRDILYGITLLAI